MGSPPETPSRTAASPRGLAAGHAFAHNLCRGSCELAAGIPPRRRHPTSPPDCRPSSLSFRCRPSPVPGFPHHIERARADPTNTVGSVDLRTTRNSSAGRVTSRLSRALSLLSLPGGTQSGCPSGYVRLRTGSDEFAPPDRPSLRDNHRQPRKDPREADQGQRRRVVRGDLRGPGGRPAAPHLLTATPAQEWRPGHTAVLARQGSAGATARRPGPSRAGLHLWQMVLGAGQIPREHPGRPRSRPGQPGSGHRP